MFFITSISDGFICLEIYKINCYVLKGETKRNEALRKLTKANESLGPSSQAPACAGGCFRWLSQRFVLFCFVSFRQNLFSVNQP